MNQENSQQISKQYATETDTLQVNYWAENVHSTGLRFKKKKKKLAKCCIALRIFFGVNPHEKSTAFPTHVNLTLKGLFSLLKKNKKLPAGWGGVKVEKN